jgi:hypothetical protein
LHLAREIARREIAVSPKSLSLEIPNAKFQVPKKLQASNPKKKLNRRRFEAWDLKFIWDLAFGI